jgi:hypothetical protein
MTERVPNKNIKSNIKEMKTKLLKYLKVLVLDLVHMFIWANEYNTLVYLQILPPTVIIHRLGYLHGASSLPYIFIRANLTALHLDVARSKNNNQVGARL